MLQEHSWLFPNWDKPSLLDSKHIQNIAISRLNGVALISEALGLDQLLETFKVVTHQDLHLIGLSCVTIQGTGSGWIRIGVLHFTIISTDERHSLFHKLYRRYLNKRSLEVIIPCRLSLWYKLRNMTLHTFAKLVVEIWIRLIILLGLLKQIVFLVN